MDTVRYAKGPGTGALMNMQQHIGMYVCMYIIMYVCMFVL